MHGEAFTSGIFRSMLSCHKPRQPQDRILIKNSRDNEARQVMMHLACRFCRGRYSLTEIAGKLNVRRGGLTRSRYNMEKRMRADKTLGRRIAKIEGDLQT